MFLCVFPLLSSAQQEALFTHYMYNTLAINPAYAGSRDALTITALHRTQWLDFPGAPQTQTLTLHSPIVGNSVNLGLSLINDKIGPVNTTGISIDYSFRISLSKKRNLAFGLKTECNAYNFDLTNLNATNPIDNQTRQMENTISPNIGFGVYYSTEQFYVGFSIPKLLENNFLYSDYTENIFMEQRHYYLISGGLITLSNNLKLKPTSLIKLTKAAPIEADFTSEFLYNDSYSLGVMYRTGDALGLLFGFAVTEQLNIGYSFDWSLVNKTANYNDGSHELILRYDFRPKRKKQYNSGKYFCKF